MKNSNVILKEERKKENLFLKFTNLCVNLVQNYLPDPFLFASILTLVVFVMGILITKQSVTQMTNHFGNEMWALLGFSMQMALVLVTGHTLANTDLVKKNLKKLASIPKNAFQAIVAVTLVATIASYINWGFGLVVGALYAKEIAKVIKKVDYRLLIASSYSGFLVWHAGISGSIPLKLASGGDDLVKVTKGAVVQAIPVSQTIFSFYGLIPFLIILITMPILNAYMHPNENIFEIDKNLIEDEKFNLNNNIKTFADKLENSILISILISLIGFIYIINYFKLNGAKLNLNIVNAIFLFTGIILHKTPKAFLNAFSNACKGTSGIILQFPFYAGIMGMMTGVNASGVSLASSISDFFVNISSVSTFPLFTFLSAGIVNFFVPSGGGQWAVQAPIMMPAGVELGVSSAKTAMSIAWGDSWTNMIQPFWALPALSIAGLNAKDIMGYCVINLIYSGIIIGLCLLFL